MLILLSAVWFFVCTVQAHLEDQNVELNGTDLVLAFMVHRHGDRTPVKLHEYLSDQPEALDQIVPPIGYGQLTDLGKRRLYEMGKFIRSRYGNYLSPSYNLSEIYIRSTDSTRTKMSVLAAMAALYRPDGNGFMKDINWVPVPYTTVPLQDDFLMGVNCPRFTQHIEEVTNNYVPEMEKYGDVIHRLSAELEQNLESAPVKIFFAYDVFVSQTNLGLPVKKSIQEMMPDIKRASDTAFDIICGNDTMLPLQAGLLLKEFLDISSDAIAGKPSQKVRIYSAHDSNVYAFRAMSRATPRQGAPSYSALFALELRKVVNTGRYVVLPIYVSSPGDLVQYLQIEGCGGLLCDVKEFYEITSPYLLDVEEWKRRCNYDKNAPFDASNYD